MSYAHVQRLAAIMEEYEATQASVTYAIRSWSEKHGRDEFMGIRKQQLDSAFMSLEPTFVIRLFSEFEGCLHQFLAIVGKLPKKPTANSLIDRTASRLKIDSHLTTNIHNVRKYRNKLVHIEADHVEEIMIADARRNVNRFLNYLP